MNRDIGGPLVLRVDVDDSNLIASLRAHREDRAKQLSVARTFVASRQFINTRMAVDQRFLQWEASLGALPNSTFSTAAAATLSRVFDADAAAFAQGESYRAFRRLLADSIVAAALDASVPPRVRTLLMRLARASASIDALADKRTFTQRDYLETAIVLPEGLFPVVATGASLADTRRAQRSMRERRRAQELARLQDRARQITDRHKAIEELTGALLRRNDGRISVRGFVLTEAEHGALSAQTKSVLRDVGITGVVDVARAVTLVENRLAATLTKDDVRPMTRMVRIGTNMLPSDVIGDLVAVDVGVARSPGPCAAEPMDGAAADDGDVTIPAGHGEARILGIADLMIVEQTLARYELNEIAHIENVLRRERRERHFRSATTTEETVSIESETIEEKEKDLASTERFELQTETQNVINANATKEAGITIHASYGPTVDATAKLGTTSSTATQHSDRASSSYGRETTSRAVNRLQTRVMERRTIKSIREVEEKNLHAFDNSDGNADISGIYRFVDKIYNAQVVNYGKRLMLQFLVPEPAALWRHALTRRPIAPVTFVNPESPGYCTVDTKSFVPLQPQDMTIDTYLYWAGKYGAEDVVPPPPSTRVISVAKKAQDALQTSSGSAGAPKIGSDAFEVDIPDGYLPTTATVNVYGETQLGAEHKLVIQVADKQVIYREPFHDPFQLTLQVAPISKLPVSINALLFHNYELLVMVFCVLRREAMEEWQLKTYLSIIKAYEAAKSRYDNAVEAARIQAGFDQAFGRNPAANREIERGEIKRACISLASGQRFETFDAMTRNVAPHGYPEIDFAEAKAEARYVELFEQSFEWNNMTYVFYPYFWSRKDEWLTLVQLADEDPLFNRFLQAGAARVQVPVRPGFESVILNYLSGVEVWDADGNFVTTEGGDESELHLSIIAELKHQLGNYDVEGSGTLAVENGGDLVLGTGTSFSSEDANRRISIGGKRYVIKSVEAADRVRLRSGYVGSNDDAATYSFGPRLVGEPWEVRVPTNLVKLDQYSIS